MYLMLVYVRIEDKRGHGILDLGNGNDGKEGMDLRYIWK